MSLLMRAVEQRILPDWFAFQGVRYLIRGRLRSLLSRGNEDYSALIESLDEQPIAVETDAANEQHYEIPSAFYDLCLGPRKKYSACFYPTGTHLLSQAEEESLGQVESRAELADGQSILELGCGWGSLSLWMAERFPKSKITAVSNSASQKEYIDQQAAERGIKNLTVITANIVNFEPKGTFDRIVSIEMFEHLRNHRALLERISGWLQKDGKLFVHIFTHRSHLYLFETTGAKNWMGRYFFTGGMMPSTWLLLHYQDFLQIEKQWWQSGMHYSKTANHWLENLDKNEQAALTVLSDTYGKREAKLWFQRWRLFFVACRELFGFRAGTEWGVSHYLFTKRG